MTKNADHTLPDIFEYIDYRRWLMDVFESLKQDDPTMTHRTFTAMCGYKSSGAIALITSGKRQLSKTAALRIAGALKLETAARRHLTHMVAFEDADDFEVRARLLKKMQANQRFQQVWGDTLDVYTFYSDWYLPILREVVSLDHFYEDPEWISAQVHGRLSPRLVREGLERLLELGYLTRDAVGRLRPAQKIISTRSELQSDVLKQHQRDMMELASKALDSQPRHMRDMRVMTVAISESQAERIKALMTEVQKEILAIVEEDEPIEVVYQLNTQWFALTDPPNSNPSEVSE